MGCQPGNGQWIIGNVVNELNSVMGLDIFTPTIYHYLKRDNEKPLEDHELL